MGQKVKLIWEYRGPEAQQIAEHYEHHLVEFMEEHSLMYRIAGTESLSEMYSVAFMVVDESEIEMVRNILRPRKAVLYQE